MKKRLPVLILLAICLASFAAAIPYEPATDHDKYDPLGVWNILLVGTVALGLFALIAVCAGAALGDMQKKALFMVLAILVVLSTAYFVGATLYKNFSAVTKGPIHWHLDFEIWNCGEKVNLLDPVGFSNKIGSSDFHEHNDDRIHIEGVVVKYSDINLRNFFSTIGGSLDQGVMRVPTNEGTLELKDGASCGGQPATLQAFLVKTQNPQDHNDWVFTQQKLENYAEYVMSPLAVIPPGDCVIFELAPGKASTEHLCETYEVAVERGDARGS